VTDRILLAGASGVFGRLLARELLDTTDAHLVLAGRNEQSLEAARRSLGSFDRTGSVVLDLFDPDDLRRAADGCVAVVCTAGPFQGLPHDLPAVAARAGAHWLDIADDPRWVLGALDDNALGAAAIERGVAVIPGLSTSPAISGLLARWGRARRPDADRAQITLFIGNRNAKGTGAISSALITGFAGRGRPVDLPVGRRRAYRFATPDDELMGRDLGLDATFAVALEWPALGWLTATIGRATKRADAEAHTSIARLLSALSAPASRLGTDVGCIQVDLWAGRSGAGDAPTDAGRTSVAAVAGQRVVILPCAIALTALLDGTLATSGVQHPATWLPVDAYVEALRARGVQLLSRTA
jgi:NAD(P)H-binding